VTVTAENYDTSNGFEVLSVLTVGLSDLSDTVVGEIQPLTVTLNRVMNEDVVLNLKTNFGTYDQIDPLAIHILAGESEWVGEVAIFEVQTDVVILAETENGNVLGNSNTFDVFEELSVIFSMLDEIKEGEEQELSITLNRILSEDININLMTNFSSGDKIIPEIITIKKGENTWVGNIIISESMEGVIILAEDQEGYYLGESNEFNVLEKVVLEKSDLIVRMFVDPKFRNRKYEPEKYIVNVYSDENLTDLIYTVEKPVEQPGDRRKIVQIFDILEVGNYFIIGEALMKHKTIPDKIKVLSSDIEIVTINVEEKTEIRLKLTERDIVCNEQEKFPILIVPGAFGENQAGLRQIKEYFKNNGYVEGCNLEVVEYDWRDGILNIRDNDLIPAIDAAKNRTEKDKVDVVAYPFGALISLSHIYSPGYQDDIRNFVLIEIFGKRLNDSDMCGLAHDAIGQNHEARSLVNYMCRRGIPNWIPGWFDGVFGGSYLSFDELQDLVLPSIEGRANLIMNKNQSPKIIFESIIQQD
ncbi:MAG: hypothetical protein KAI16_03000, partial [Candidatus Pacebacteria bacterium]|nr:hypothetical protein [Candidatus Paceibacterota bacterium]